MKEKFKAYLMLLPAGIFFLIFIIIPLFYTFYLSFFDWNMIKVNKKFVGFDNYIELFKNPIFYRILINTFIYIIILLVLNFLLPYILAFILGVIVKKFRSFYRASFFLPSLISLVIGSVLYTWILNPVSGPIAIILKQFSMTLPIWSKTQGFVIVVISIITTWKVFGYNFIVIMGAIAGIDESIIEAAKIDGVSNFKLFKDIVLPASSATGIYIFIMTIVQGLQYIFTPIKVITQGGPNYYSSSLIYHAYHEGFILYRTGVSSALSMVTMIIFVILLLLEFKFVERGIYYEN